MFEALIWSYLPLAGGFALALIVLALSHYLLLMRRRELGSEARLPRQLILLALTVLSMLVLIILAPMPEATRTQVFGLLGIVLSGVVALSSAPFVTNFMASVMLRVTKPFSVGDFIRVGELYGKVSERGLFDTEIQTENRELIAIPNATFISQPVTVVRNSGVIVSTALSLGYELSYNKAEPLMIQAAEKAGLSDPYVHIMELGDFSVNYRVCGLLLDVQGVLTAHSELNRQLLHTLHGAGLEIVSPAITRHITQPADTRIVPPVQTAAAPEQRIKAEEIVFDKARDIEQLEQARSDLQQQISDLRLSKDTSTERKDSLLEKLAHIEDALKTLMKES